MIRSVLTLRARDGQAKAVEELYRERGVLERSTNFPGCLGSTLLRCADGGPNSHLVIADWDDADAYARWVGDPWRAEVTKDLTGLLDIGAGESVLGGLFEPVLPQSSAHTTPEEFS